MRGLRDVASQLLRGRREWGRGLSLGLPGVESEPSAQPWAGTKSLYGCLEVSRREEEVISENRGMPNTEYVGTQTFR